MMEYIRQDGEVVKFTTIFEGTPTTFVGFKHPEKEYIIIGRAFHTESEEDLIIYQEKAGDKKMYARPINMFFSLVDRTKYPLEKFPEYGQKYRFEIKEVN